MAEEASVIHELTSFFDECVEFIPESVYLQPNDEYSQNARFNFKRNGNSQKIQEMKEQSQKRRREKFDPEKETTMTEKIEERRIQMEKEAEQEIATAVPMVKTERAKDLDELRSRLKQKIEVLAKNRIENEKKRKQKQDANRTAKKGKKEPAKKEASPETSEPAEESAPKESPSPRLAPTVSDVISNIQFGKVKATQEVDTQNRPKARKDIHKLLKQAQKKQDYLKNLKTTEAGRKEAENIEMEAALKKAAGFRKKDNPALLKKTIKRQEAKKKKSQEEWKNRKYAERKNKEKKENKNRPGFEGKKKGFLNGKGKKAEAPKS